MFWVGGTAKKSQKSTLCTHLVHYILHFTAKGREPSHTDWSTEKVLHVWEFWRSFSPVQFRPVHSPHELRAGPTVRWTFTVAELGRGRLIAVGFLSFREGCVSHYWSFHWEPPMNFQGGPGLQKRKKKLGSPIAIPLCDSTECTLHSETRLALYQESLTWLCSFG